MGSRSHKVCRKYLRGAIGWARPNRGNVHRPHAYSAHVMKNSLFQARQLFCHSLQRTGSPPLQQFFGKGEKCWHRDFPLLFFSLCR